MAKSVLVTGATGFLGSYLVLRRLTGSDDRLYCLVRGKRGTTPDGRLRRKLAAMLAGPLGEDPRFHGARPDDRERLVVLAGDVREEGLGEAARAGVRFDEVWHCAADISFEDHRREQLLETNVQGTRNVLDLLAALGVPALHYVSTAYVAGERHGAIPEGPFDPAWPVVNAYEETKRLGEEMVLEAGRRTGLAVRIFRPSIIVGHSRTLEVDSSSGLYGYLTLMLRLKEALDQRMPEYFQHHPLQLSAAPDADLNLICVDHVVEAMAAIAGREESAGGFFHLTNPRPVPLLPYYDTTAEAFGLRIVHAPREEDLNPIDYLFHAQTGVFNSYLQRPKAFQCGEMLRLSGLAPADLAIDKEMELRLTRQVHTRFNEDLRVERQRLRSVTKALERRTLELPGREPLGYYSGGGGGRGRGDAVAVLNAYGQSLAFWDWTIGRLAARHPVITWQMRGTLAQSGGVERVHPVLDHVDDLVGILDREGVERCTLLGWCTGPKLALELYARHPGRVAAMVFLTGCFKNLPGLEGLHTGYEVYMDTLCRMVDKNPAIADSLLETLRGILAGRKTEAPKAAAGAESDRLVRDVLGLVPEDIKPLVIEPFLTPASVVNYGRQLLSFWDHDVAPLLGQVGVPVLFIGGEMDNIAAAAMSREVARRTPGAVYAEIKGGSHYLQHDNHRLLVELVESFLRDGPDFAFPHGLVTLERWPETAAPPPGPPPAAPALAV